MPTLRATGVMAFALRGQGVPTCRERDRGQARDSRRRQLPDHVAPPPIRFSDLHDTYAKPYPREATGRLGLCAASVHTANTQARLSERGRTRTPVRVEPPQLTAYDPRRSLCHRRATVTATPTSKLRLIKATAPQNPDATVRTLAAGAGWAMGAAGGFSRTGARAARPSAALGDPASPTTTAPTIPGWMMQEDGSIPG